MQTIRIAKKEYSPEKVIEAARRAAGWFRLIGIFSVVNTVLQHTSSQIRFVVGLGATQLVDGIAVGLQQKLSGGAATAAMILGLGVDALIIGSFFLVWYLANNSSKAAYVTGLVFYLLDSLIMFAFEDWVGLGFHAFFLFLILGGLSFINARKQAEAMLAVPAPSSLP